MENQESPFKGITEHLGRERALKESEELFSKTFHANPAAMAISTLDAVYIDVNESYAKLTGYSRDEIIGKTSIELNIITPADRERYINNLKNGSIQKIESELTNKSGQKLNVISSSETIEINGEIRIISFIYDITERKKTEEKLRESEERFRAVQENSLDRFTILKPVYDDKGEIIDFTYVYQNAQAAKTTGHRPEELVGLRMTEIFPTFPKTRFFDIYKQALETGQVLEFEEHYNADGVDDWFYATITPISNGIAIATQIITERKQAEEALKESEEKLRTLFENLSVGISVLDKERKVIYENPTLEKIMDLSKEDLKLGKYAERRYFNSDMTEISLDELPSTKAFNRQAPVKDIEVGILKEDNSMIWTNVSAIPLPFPDWNMLLVTSDITKRKKAEKEKQSLINTIQEERDKLVSLVNNIPDEVWFADTNKKFTLANPSALREFGMVSANVDVEEMATNIEVYRPDGSPRPVNEAPPLLALKGEVVRNLEEVIKTPGSRELRYRQVNASPVKNANNNIIGSVSVVRDITELKKVEEELRQARDHLEEQVEVRTSELEGAYQNLKASELKFKTLAENSVDIIDRQDRQFRHLFVNNIIYKLLGIPPEDFIGKTNRELGMSEELVNLWESKTQEVFDTGKIGHMEFELPTQNGINYYQSILVPEYNPNNKIESVLIISRDITERKQAEEQLKEIITELEHSNHELQSFAYITSHDLQEPLRTIASYAQLMERRYKGQLDESADDFLDFMVAGATRMKEQIQGLLDYSRVGTQGKEFTDFYADVALENALSNLKSSIEECNAKITYDSLPLITADENQITRVFQNLIGNALKFHKEGIRPEIHITSYKTKNEKGYVFSVSDNGIGIEEQYIDNIFEVFKKLHAIGEYQGAGIGLAIVKRIVDRHGGRVWVESDFGMGSTFYFTIPIKE